MDLEFIKLYEYLSNLNESDVTAKNLDRDKLASYDEILAEEDPFEVHTDRNFEEVKTWYELAHGAKNWPSGGGIYVIENKNNNNAYIGKASSFKTRLSAHRRASTRDSKYLHAAINKYGAETFRWGVLKEIPEYTYKAGSYWEIFYIEKYNTLDNKVDYNLTSGGDGGAQPEFTRAQLLLILFRLQELNSGKTYKGIAIELANDFLRLNEKKDKSKEDSEEEVNDNSEQNKGVKTSISIDTLRNINKTFYYKAADSYRHRDWRSNMILQILQNYEQIFAEECQRFPWLEDFKLKEDQIAFLLGSIAKEEEASGLFGKASGKIQVRRYKLTDLETNDALIADLVSDKPQCGVQLILKPVSQTQHNGPVYYLDGHRVNRNNLLLFGRKRDNIDKLRNIYNKDGARAVFDEIVKIKNKKTANGATNLKDQEHVYRFIKDEL